MSSHHLSRWFTFVVWAAVAGSGLFWALKLLVKSPQLATPAPVVDASAALRGDITRVLGADPVALAAAAAPEPAADARFSLVGVVSPRSPQAAREGLALIAVDGKPAKAFRVGSVVEGSQVLQAVNARGASLGPRDGPALVALKLAPPTAANTGTLPNVLPNSSMPGAQMPNAPGALPVLPFAARLPPQPTAMPVPADPGVPARTHRGQRELSQMK